MSFLCHLRPLKYVIFMLSEKAFLRPFRGFLLLPGVEAVWHNNFLKSVLLERVPVVAEDVLIDAEQLLDVHACHRAVQSARCWPWTQQDAEWSAIFGLQRSFSCSKHREHSCWCRRHTSGGRWAHRWAAGATWSCWPRAVTCWPMLKHCSNAAAWSMLFALFLWKRLWLVKEEKQGSIAKFQGVKSALCWNFGS